MKEIREYKNMSDDEYHKTFLENRHKEYDQEIENDILIEEQENDKFEKLLITFTICLFLILGVVSLIFHINSNS